LPPGIRLVLHTTYESSWLSDFRQLEFQNMFFFRSRVQRYYGIEVWKYAIASKKFIHFILKNMAINIKDNKTKHQTVEA